MPTWVPHPASGVRDTQALVKTRSSLQTLTCTHTGRCTSENPVPWGQSTHAALTLRQAPEGLEERDSAPVLISYLVTHNVSNCQIFKKQIFRMVINVLNPCHSQTQGLRAHEDPQIITKLSLLTKPKNPRHSCGHQLFFFQILKWYFAYTYFRSIVTFWRT